MSIKLIVTRFVVSLTRDIEQRTKKFKNIVVARKRVSRSNQRIHSSETVLDLIFISDYFGSVHTQ